MGGIITLTTDWGLTNIYSAIFKANVLKEAPESIFVDISHNIVKNETKGFETVYIISAAYKFFPEGSVHVVDVRYINSENRKALINKKTPYRFLYRLGLRIKGHYFLMENNGLWARLCDKFDEIEEVVLLPEDERYKRFGTFNALNFYAHPAAMLSMGASLFELGQEFSKEFLSVYKLPKINIEGNKIFCNIQHIDDYGNIITDLTEAVYDEVAKGRKTMKVKFSANIESLDVVHLRKAYNIGDLLYFAVFNISGFLELGIQSGNLSAVLGLDNVGSIQDTVTIEFLD